MNISKKRYIQAFLLAVIFLAIVRAVNDSRHSKPEEKSEVLSADAISMQEPDTLPVESLQISEEEQPRSQSQTSTEKPHKIFSVPGYAKTFPDQNDVQLVAANRWGVSPVENRAEAERRKMELVYIGSNPYFYVDKLYSSIPYLVPRASELLQQLGQNFYDSLQVKGVPLHKIIVTSALRSKEDVARLQRRNSNATPNSCHLRGTTFDISYNRYKTVAPPGVERREVRNDTLRFVLSEALRDLREQGRCYVKYERKQGCYHITVR